MMLQTSIKEEWTNQVIRTGMNYLFHSSNYFKAKQRMGTTYAKESNGKRISNIEGVVSTTNEKKGTDADSTASAPIEEHVFSTSPLK
uniref:Uncharacterized protein n=1 Tax=Pristionchus pacificus TaxID=54126 RepID=A0A2A6B609_PRIPA|eukprot:PDM61320.1 hypothetical protein PRIPAC_50762 [Pristionchus pacificus]